MRLPLFYQLEPALFRAARSAGAFIFVNDQENMPVGAMAIADGSMDVVVTTQKDSVVFSQFLTERSLQLPRAWIVLHRADQPWELPAALLSPAARVAQEVHLFPGLPVLTQCPALIDAKAPRFHAAAGMAVNPLKTGARVSGPMGDPVPLSEYQLNIPLSESGMCACGLPVYALTATK